TGGVTIDGGSTLDIGVFDDATGNVALIDGTIAGTTGVLTGTSYEVQDGTIAAKLGGSSNVALTKTTRSTVTFAKSGSTYPGGTVVTDGTLVATAADALPSYRPLTVAGGVFDIGGVNASNVGFVTLVAGEIRSTTGVLTATDYEVQSGVVSAIIAGDDLTKT